MASKAPTRNMVMHRLVALLVFIPFIVSRPVTTRATVLRVTDGDTISVAIAGCPLESVKVRYIGIDTPERGECLWKEATTRNTELVLDKAVYLERDTSEWDRYSRLLRHVYVGEQWVNGALVAQGYARVTTYRPDDRYEDALLRLEAEAKEAKRGGWGKCRW